MPDADRRSRRGRMFPEVGRMSYFDSGVSSYVRAKAAVTVNFPVDMRGNADINCTQCFFFRKRQGAVGLPGKSASTRQNMWAIAALWKL